MNESDYLLKALGDNGYKTTSQRALVYEVLSENKDQHLSTEEVYELVKKKNSNMGIATIYRTLQLFEEIGLVYKHNFDDGCSRYEILSPNSNEVHQHHHLLCKKCGRIIEVKEDLMNSLEEMIEKQYNFEILNHVVKFTGICDLCRNKENEDGNRKKT
ncbi:MULTISPECIES: Fur family transcriptional regulator [unclassified Sedimentibacter]|uniref:Fur family transcriptional regulator n=1 Tax=unclassified Sedimentibacter TaxID=2649220 RepID=UPI0027E1CF07|nr:transcriptional repressor [Sedimentibacter sp. MB35-C1]WMJ75846.1 transcriptional repressor [Sedimentibacter sp. MB35-C1]